MAKRVFFSFHYQDVADFRANVVRQSGVTKERGESGFFDSSLWEKSRISGDAAIKRLIDNGLDGTSHTAVLIGSDTFQRRWVRYEILKSIWKGNGITGIHINKVQCKNQRTKYHGPNPLDFLGLKYNEKGNAVYPCEWNGDKWIYANDIAGWSLEVPRPSNKNQLITLSSLYNTYCWKDHDGYNNFGKWIGA